MSQGEVMRIIEGGHFRVSDEIKRLIADADVMQAGSEQVIRSMADATPIGISPYDRHKGLGRASWQAVGQPEWAGDQFRQAVTNTAENRNVRYIPIADVRSKLNAGFIDRGASQAEAKVYDAMMARLETIIDKLWVVEK